MLFAALALVSLPFLDIELHRPDPWQELGRIGLGLLQPRWDDAASLAQAVLYTLAFAFCAVTLAVAAGGVLALFYHRWPVRVACAATRAVHELFWGLLFMQFFGLSALTGVLAIALPFSGIFARVFADIFAEQSTLPRQVIAPGRVSLSALCYTTLAQAWPQLTSYLRYRFECALRSSAILGFIGLPTVGFHLESAFRQGDYAEAACLLWVFYVMIATLRWWLDRRLIPLYCLIAFFVLPPSPPVSVSLLGEFVTRDIWPLALREGDYIGALAWYAQEVTRVVLPAAAYTVMLSLVALAAAGVVVLFLFPIASRVCVGRLAIAGHALLVFVRSTPELLLAFVFLLLVGPSALPAILALAIHNGGLVSYLTAREADRLPLRADHAHGINLWAYELVPRLFPRMFALLLYRWEVMMRESAILGILGVATLGFYVDSAFAQFRMDRAFLLIAATALLNIAADAVSQRVNRGLRFEADALARDC
ncbi:hypothetical protein E4634_20675 [Mangrovimicrobium sediminis]|uniref:ABC transporter permease n=1 Tax=Mangrovimicrobium sediminis TaxID=2562682 RepID=A0A4Z0LU71_9GAMM|nr:hypothetical protein E4634_20675 [Haliea sp. SAOS-164]